MAWPARKTYKPEDLEIFGSPDQAQPPAKKAYRPEDLEIFGAPDAAAEQQPSTPPAAAKTGEPVTDEMIRDYAAKEMARLQAEREDAYSFPVLNPFGNRRERRAKADDAIESHIKEFGHVLPERFSTPAPEGLRGRAAAAWRAEESAKLAPRAAVGVDGIARTIEGNPIVAFGGKGEAKAWPRRSRRMLDGRVMGPSGEAKPGSWQFVAEDGIVRDENGFALPLNEIDQKDPTLGDRAKEIGQALMVKGVSLTAPTALGLEKPSDFARRQEMTAETDRLESLARKSIAMREEGLRSDATDEAKRVLRHVDEYVPMFGGLPKLMKLAEVNSIIGKDRAWEAWDASGRNGPEPEAVTPFEQALVREHFADKALAADVGKTFGGQAAQGAAWLLPFIAEMGMTAGAAGVAEKGVRAGARAAVTKVAGEAAAAKLGQWTAKSLTGKLVAGGVGAGLAGGLARVAATPAGFAADYVERRLPNGRVPDLENPEARITYKPGQGAEEAVWNTLFDRWGNYATEVMGEGFEAVGGAAARKALSKLPAATQAAIKASKVGRAAYWMARAESGAKAPGKMMPMSRALRGARVSGMPGEFGEEVAAKVWNEVFGVDLTPEQVNDPLLKRFDRMLMEPDEAAVTAMVLMIPGAMTGGAAYLDTRVERAQAYKAAKDIREEAGKRFQQRREACAAAGVDYDAYEMDGRETAAAAAEFIYQRDLAALHPVGSPQHAAANQAMAAAEARYRSADAKMRAKFGQLKAELERTMAPYGGQIEDVDPATVSPDDRAKIRALMDAIQYAGIHQAAIWQNRRWSPFSANPVVPEAEAGQPPAAAQPPPAATPPAEAEDDLDYGEKPKPRAVLPPPRGSAPSTQPRGPSPTAPVAPVAGAAAAAAITPAQPALPTPPPEEKPEDRAKRLLGQGSTPEVVDAVVQQAGTAVVGQVKTAAAEAAEAAEAERKTQFEANYRKLQSSLARRAKTSKQPLPPADVQILVTFAAKSGFGPLRVYRDLRAMGLESRAAVDEVRRAWPEFVLQKTRATDGAEIYTLVDAIRDIGGLRPWKNRDDGSASLRSDYGANIPNWLRNKNGMPLDQALQHVNTMGWNFETIDAMVEELARVAMSGNLDAERNPGKHLDDAEADEAAAYEEWEKSGSELIPIGEFEEGATWSAFGERFRAVELGDQAMRVKSLRNGAETWLAYDSVEKIRVDKGSLKKAGPAETDRVSTAAAAAAPAVGMSDDQKEEAVDWAMRTHPAAFMAVAHARNSLAKLIAENPGVSSDQLRAKWIEKVTEKAKPTPRDDRPLFGADVKPIKAKRTVVPEPRKPKAAAPAEPAQSARTPGDGLPGGGPVAVAPVEPEKLAFEGYEKGKRIEFPNRAAAEENVAREKSRKGFTDYIVTIEKNGDTYSVKYQRKDYGKLKGTPEAVAERMAWRKDLHQFEKYDGNNAYDQNELDRRRWLSIENMYITRRAAEAALPGINVGTDKSRIIVVQRGYGSDAVIIDNAFAAHADMASVSDRFSELYPVGRGTSIASSSVPVFSPRLGEPTYKKWLAGEKWDPAAVRRMPKPRRVDPQMELLPVAAPAVTTPPAVENPAAQPAMPVFEQYKGDVPSILFHSGALEIKAFDKGKMGSANGHGWRGIGFYFAADPTYSSYYIPEEEKSGFIHSARVSIKRPFLWNESNVRRLSGLDPAKNGGMGINVAQLLAVMDEGVARKLTDRIKAAGFDGIVYSSKDVVNHRPLTDNDVSTLAQAPERGGYSDIESVVWSWQQEHDDANPSWADLLNKDVIEEDALKILAEKWGWDTQPLMDESEFVAFEPEQIEILGVEKADSPWLKHRKQQSDTSTPSASALAAEPQTPPAGEAVSQPGAVRPEAAQAEPISKGGVTSSRPVMPEARPATVGVVDRAAKMRGELQAKYGEHWYRDKLSTPEELKAWNALIVEVRAFVADLRKKGGARWWDIPAVQAAQAAQEAEKETIFDASPERRALRVSIAKRLYGAGAQKKERQIWVVMGLPGAGKSNVVGNKIVEDHGVIEIDADRAKSELPEYEGGAHAGRVHKESAKIAEDHIMQELAVSAGDNIMFPTVGKNGAKLSDLVKGWKEKGYRVHLVYVEVDADSSIERALVRWLETGRFVSPHYIAGLGLHPSQTFDRVKTEVDTYEHWNNEVPRGSDPILVERGGAVLRAGAPRQEDGGNGAGDTGADQPAAAPEADTRTSPDDRGEPGSAGSPDVGDGTPRPGGETGLTSTPAAATAAAPDIKDNAPEPFFKVGQRVVFKNTRGGARRYANLAGRHGTITDAHTSVMQSLFGGGPGSRSFSNFYTVKTDAGADAQVVSANDVEVETGPAPAVVPDPVIDGEARTVDYHINVRAMELDYARRARNSAARRHKPALRQRDLAEVDRREKAAKVIEDALAEWAKQNPDAAAAVEGLDTLLKASALKPAQAAPRPVMPAPAGQTSPAGQKAPGGQPAQIVEQFHTKRQRKVWIVTMANRVEADEYARLASRAKYLGGKWSREWRPTNSPAGFMFEDQKSAETFRDEFNDRHGTAAAAPAAQPSAPAPKPEPEKAVMPPARRPKAGLMGTGAPPGGWADADLVMPEGWKMPKDLADRLGHGQSVPVPDHPNYNFAVYYRKPDAIPDRFKVVLSRQSDGGFFVVAGTGMTPGEAYRSAVRQAIDREKAHQAANKHVTTPVARRLVPYDPVKNPGEPDAPTATLDAAKQARLAEIQKKLRGKFGDGTVRESPAEYAGQSPSAFDPEALTLAAEMAGLYAESGIGTFVDFVSAVQKDMPDAWSGLKSYLHGAWTTAGAHHPEIEEISRKAAADAVAMIDRATVPALQPSVEPSTIPSVSQSAPRPVLPPARSSSHDDVQDDLFTANGAAQAPGVRPAVQSTGGAGSKPAGGRPAARNTAGATGQRDADGLLPFGDTGRTEGGNRGQGGGQGLDGTAAGQAGSDLQGGAGEHGSAGDGDRVGAGGPSRVGGLGSDGGRGSRSGVRPGGESGGPVADDLLAPAGTLGSAAQGSDSGARPGIAAGQGTPAETGRSGAVVPGDGLNFRARPEDMEVGGGAVTKARANIAAIRTLKRIQAEGRLATPEEKRILAKYVGWGHTGLKNKMFPLQDRNAVMSSDAAERSTFADLARELKALLTPDEYETAVRSVQYAHYSGPAIIEKMWMAARHLGFRGGRAFEPGFGVGRFVGLIPDDLAGEVVFTGVEMDGISAGIAKALYPESDMREQDFVEFPYMGEIYDLMIGNPPFSSRTVTSDRRYAKEKLVLHDYFIRKSMDMLKPGGLMILITSHGTMDKKNDKARELIASQADLIGAVRMPQTAFKADAGTEVVTDILFLRKRADGAAPAGEPWMEIVELDTPDGGKALVNEYFVANVGMTLGVHSMAGKMRFGGGREYTVLPRDGRDLIEDLAEAIQRMPAAEVPDVAPVSAPVNTGASDAAAALKTAAAGMLDGGFVIGSDGQLYLSDGGKLTPVKPYASRKDEDADSGTGAVYKAKKNIPLIRHYIPLREAYRRVLSLQRDGTDSELEAAQREMRSAYYTFKLSHGALHAYTTSDRTDSDTGEVTTIVRYPMLSALVEDTYAGGVFSLEEVDKDGDIVGLSKLFTERVAGVLPPPKIESASDALAVVLHHSNRPDLAKVATLRSATVEQVEAELGNRVFRDHETGEWVMGEAYLSGNVRKKLAAAREKAAADPAYARNVTALEAIQPDPLPVSRIKLNLGMPIVPESDIVQFMREVAGVKVEVKLTNVLGRWSVEFISGGSSGVNKYGTLQRSPGQILASALNGKPVTVHVRDPQGNEQVDPAATAAANEKVSQLRAAWESWVWADPQRMIRLAKAFNDKYNVWRRQDWDGSHLVFPGLSKFFKPYPHQTGMVWRALQLGNTYAVHDVGLGKTLAAAMTIMEKRRLGQAKRCMVVVPNSMLAQWNQDFLAAYPAARLLLADEENFTKSRRQRFLGRVANSDYDAVIITHSAFKLMPLNPETEAAFIRVELDKFRKALAEAGGTVGGARGRDRRDATQQAIQLAIESMEDKLTALGNMRRDKGLTWDDLGIDDLTVDEAHNFRKLRFATQRRMKGISPDGSEAAWDLYMKTQTIQQRTPGRGLLFLSGTPIVNTMGEVFSVQRFLQPNVLADTGLETFDSWVATFGREKTEYEKTAGVGYKAVTRMASWHNMTMLSGMWQQISDYRQFADLSYMNSRRPDMLENAILPMTVPETDTQKHYRVKVLQARIEAIARRHGKPQPGDDIMLTVITDGIHAALDERFINPRLEPNPDTKLERMIADVAKIWREGAHDKRTQLIFMDKGLPDMLETRGFSAYLRVRQGLIDAGIPANEVVFFKDWDTSEKKRKLQSLFNDGDIRVMIGSMQAMGTGLNVQKRLYAIHFATIPWYPALVEQAIGRIIRQGNKFAGDAEGKGRTPVLVKAWVTKGTLEEYMWGLVKTKGLWIRGFFAGATDEMGGELDSESDNYAMLAAMASADPRVQELAKLQAELAKLQMLERAHLDTQAYQMQSITQYRLQSRLAQEGAEEERAWPEAPDTVGDKFSMTVGTATYSQRREAAAALFKAAEGVWSDTTQNQSDVPIGAFGPHYPLSATSFWNPHTGKREWFITLHVRKPDGKLGKVHADRFDPAYREDLTPDGLLKSVEHWIRKAHIREGVADAEARAVEYERQAKEREASLEKWTRTEEAEKLRTQIREMQAAVVADGIAAEKAAAAAHRQGGGAVHETSAAYGPKPGGEFHRVSDAQVAKHVAQWGGNLPPFLGNWTVRQEPDGTWSVYNSDGEREVRGEPTRDRAIYTAMPPLAVKKAAVHEAAAPYRAMDAALRSQFPDPQGAQATAAVRAALVQMELALAAPDVPYQAPARAVSPPARGVKSLLAKLAERRAKIVEALSSPGAMARAMRDGEGRLDLRFSRVAYDFPDMPFVLDIKSGLKIESPKDVAALVFKLRTPLFERFIGVALDKNQKVLRGRVISVGLVDASPVHPREAFSWVPEGAVDVIFTHNHPSGDSTPSIEDLRVSRQLIEAGRVLGYRVIDHVTTNGEYRSMRNAGLVKFDGKEPWLDHYEAEPAYQQMELADWELVRYDQRPAVRDYAKVAQIVKPMIEHAGEGKWLHVIMVDTKNRLLSVARISGGRSVDETVKRVQRTIIGYGGVSGYMVSFSWQGADVEKLARSIASASQITGMRVWDFMDYRYQSAREMGVLTAEGLVTSSSIWNGPVVYTQPDEIGAGVDRMLAAESPAVRAPRSVMPAARGEAVRETPAPYGVDDSSDGQGGPDWGAYADLAQRIADMERNRDRSVEITRAIERDRMSRLAKEMQGLRRQVAKTDADRAAGKTMRAEPNAAAAAEFRRVTGADPRRGETFADLLLEAISIGRAKGLAQKAKRDIRAAVRDALNARVKRLMAASNLPTNWAAVNAARNAAMLRVLDQAELGFQGMPPAEVNGAKKAAVRRLLGGGPDVEAALAGMGDSEYVDLFKEVRAAIERDLRAYYRTELTRLFGGRPTRITLPDGRQVQSKTVGVVHAGMTRMTDEPRRAMQALIDRVDWDGLAALRWNELQAIVDEAKRLLADDDLAKQAIIAGHKTRRADLAAQVAGEVEAARDPLKEAAAHDPRKGGVSQRLAWWRAAAGTRALLLAGGDESSATYAVLYKSLLAANRRQLDLEAEANREMDDLLKGLGYTKKDLLDMDYVLLPVTLPDGTEISLTRGEMMTVYGMTLDEDAREKLLGNGWRPSRFRADPTRTVSGEGETYEDRQAAAVSNVEYIVGLLTDRERSVVEWMVRERSAKWARLANETSRLVSGVSLFGDQPHITLSQAVDREAELPDVDDPAGGFRRHMVDRMGLTKERMAHSHPLLVRPLLSIYRMQARDMSTYIAWSVPYRDAISLVSRGPAKSAIVQRWGTAVLVDLKDSLAFLTYQKGHTDNFNALQRFLQGRERAAATFILGGRLSTIALNRYAGSIMLAARLAAEGGPKGPALAAKFLGLVLRPQVGMERAWMPSRRAVRDRLLQNGYFWDRWGRHAFRVFGQLSSQRMEMEEAEARNTSLAALRRRQAWKDISTWMLSGMQKAEVANAIDLYNVLTGAGWDEERAIEAIERWTRETQNPSSPLEQSGQYTHIRTGGLGVALPFLGQPSVVADQLLGDYIRSKQSRKWRRFVMLAIAGLASAAFTVLLRAMIRRASKDMLDPEDVDKRENVNTLLDASGATADLVIPGVGRAIEGIGRPIAAAASANKGMLSPSQATDETLLGQSYTAMTGIGNSLVKWNIDGEIDDAHAERLFLDVHRTLGLMLGLPTGGVEQAVRAGAGAAGEPIGKREVMPKPRR
jgi:N12 class adenine-specific DNA methylase/predicted ABC-type ATPase